MSYCNDLLIIGNSDLESHTEHVEIMLMTYEQELSQDGHLGSCNISLRDTKTNSISHLPISDFLNNVTNAKLVVEICIYNDKVTTLHESD